MTSNYANVYSSNNGPLKANVNELVVFTNTDTTDFQISGSRLICKNAGTWTFVSQYQLYSNITSTEYAKAILDGWFLLNGSAIPGSDASSSTAILSGTNVLVIESVLELNVDDYVELGIRCSSYNSKVDVEVKDILDQYEIGTPSVILSLLKIVNVPSEFKDYANFYSTLTYPKNVNENEYLTITNVDTPDFTLDVDKIICNNPGIWSIMSQYQMYCLNSSTIGQNAQIDVWANVNGIDIRFSNASANVVLKGQTNVICLSGNLLFNKGDYIKIGIRSSSLDGILNTQCIGWTSSSGVYVPSIIGTAHKVNYAPIIISPTELYSNAVNINSFGTFPSLPNKAEYIVYDYISSQDFTISGTKLICNNAGTWTFCTQYQCSCYADSIAGINSQINGWFSKNGKAISQSNAILSCTTLGESNILVVQAVIELNINDYIEVGILSNSIDNKLNVAVETFLGPTGITSPCSRLVANKF